MARGALRLKETKGDSGSSGGESGEENWRFFRISLEFSFRLSADEEMVRESSDGTEATEGTEGCEEVI
ncbi:hypothetical protein PanWU01x14_097840 [Parasponia andersonii]|uniref:Uncharacterized protein n=1 Tax=Parasponia andersonii TaxID=3476 RepID=A0A2P5D4J3_PARAD|nr:hypothetical protein PanWU01x14_097840 [Parasponia andersonii]